MNWALWMLIIPGAFSAYCIIGVIVYVLFCKLMDDPEWEKAKHNAADWDVKWFRCVVFFWPMLTATIVIVCLPLALIECIVDQAKKNARRK